ncbi:competence type IV pilus major pilin ComGC [Sporolactobacillus inulinus]|jgi:competence protein ComGC|uniref:ComG operon protein 3 n=2 Tax=Sporolactobacillus inulinus TaxID=2078 RepID=A0A4Y3T4V8_9BACL|nr:competence type IV pilus major pilin ComGC [Sporolactobacillus inulinus]KLI02588.1 competence protein ComG [Sporolactobacillus inulinus CASD]GAY75286.1 late competence protein ComGC [Sporolactobacillus inulinus]GEB76694.1 ComG operon protein 3 [Sporolactobacillus inulinus]
MIKAVHKFILTSQRGFTLIEMMIVLFIISVLLLIAVPNMTKSNVVVQKKSTDATVQLVQGQVAAYQTNHNGDLPDNLDELVPEYVSSITASNGKPLVYNATTGEVSAPADE